MPTADHPLRPALERLPANTHGRDLVVGDVHGMHTLLMTELARVGFDPAVDRLLGVGDLVDRGPESLQALTLLDEPWFHSVLGNHEASVLAAAGRLAEAAVQPGGWHAEAHRWFHGLAPAQRQAVCVRLARLPWALEVATAAGPVGIVHAEVPAVYASWAEFLAELDGPLAAATRQAAVRGRELHRLAEYRGGWEAADPAPGRDFVLAGVRHVIHGHSQAVDFRIHHLGNRYWIDCGAQYCTRPDLIAGWHERPSLCLVDLRDPATPL